GFRSHSPGLPRKRLPWGTTNTSISSTLKGLHQTRVAGWCNPFCESDTVEVEVRMNFDQVMNALKEASEGLVFISETDAPLEPFQWSGGPDPSPESIIERADAEKDTPVECITLDQFFRAVSKEDKPQFDKLSAVLRQNLSDIKVYKVGETEKSVFIVGKTAAG